jgi:hypothetical protein
VQNTIVRTYRTHPDDTGPVSGIIEDTDSGQKASFHNPNDLKTMLVDSIMKGLPGFQHRHFLLSSGASIRQEMML